ncbi:MAG: NADPH:quinone oxidoreductase family protein [Actinobacteria bacterium]|nr:NADPH:quinone oxidoreductase family protein [Actinomycetota bacterium]
MRSWLIHELGDPIDRLALDEVEPPEAGAGRVVLDIEAVGLAFPNVLQCRGEYQVKPPLPFSPAAEVVGRVAELGEGVVGLEIGQRVVCLGGALAEQAVVAAASAFAVPDGIAPEKAVALPTNYGTTWYALHDRAHLQPGETLLVTGASGGTGSAAIQLGLAAGARVIAVAGGPEKVAACEALGADEVVDHRQVDDLVERVRELTGGSGVDVAYDPVGGEMFQQVRRCMAWNGRLLVIGFVAGIPEIATNHVLLKNYSVVGVHWGASLARDAGSLGRQMGELFALAESGAVDPLLHPVYGFDDAARALQDIADRQVVGKVVVAAGS